MAAVGGKKKAGLGSVAWVRAWWLAGLARGGPGAAGAKRDDPVLLLRLDARETMGLRQHRLLTAELPGVTGHYSAHTHPDQLAADIRSFFCPLRPATPTSTPATTATGNAMTKEL